MLTRLTISNYALIDKLTVEFHPQLNTVTGETGAGKSIILGALGLILGNRADLAVLKDDTKKCIVEGSFHVINYALKDFFSANDLDYDDLTILRREITPAGKSRAFVNDTPVNLKTIRELGLKLIDIHSQHQNLELGNQQFQMRLVDSVAKSENVLYEYQVAFKEYKSLESSLGRLKEQAEKARADLDYYQFQFQQLEGLNLKELEQDELEAELERLTHAEEIKGALNRVGLMLDDEQFSVLQNLKEAQKSIESILNYISEAPAISERLQSSFLELKDISEEVLYLAEKVEYNPGRIETIHERLNEIYAVQQKHAVSTVGELLDIKDKLDKKIASIVGFDEEISKTENKLNEQQKLLEKKAAELTLLRKRAYPSIEKSIVNDLKQLGMEKSALVIKHDQLNDFGPTGNDQIAFLFSANQDAGLAEISKIASGGEMSRLMLAIKNLMRNSKSLPTVIFDEIDAGVSGEVAIKMGNIIESFSSNTQIINITHLPQIAAKGAAHFHVYKLHKTGKTYTSIRQLSEDERIEELAKMVGGEKISDVTLKTAQELLNGRN